jgi:hypothetical protein
MSDANAKAELSHLTIEIRYTIDLVLYIVRHRRPYKAEEYPRQVANRVSSWPRRLELGYCYPSIVYGCHPRSGRSTVPFTVLHVRQHIDSGGIQVDSYLIFLSVMRKRFLSFFLISRRFRSALPEIKIRHWPNPSTLSKYNAAFIG